ncbi:putative disease resistance protein RGA4 [Quercus robur]|uniref:putative disease resistance protein RGA4 n=1 Tax=Quercus robur TaxID=38942 RepID=UPI0021622E1E|nr:putative disease resistance protein RGA4 [Quercus robur]XP_050255793.1 putative disease resistance protein RGA4 [Quercus robur]XP_050255794.1 putative disease resistance protein RGA4 [Quercus robur]XP_050255795.1 putative disease resistance protein RGA4 [Quercus robur]XP_050255796.1 putative disease resistance protein RGA4 [Quercus robur]XP_050255797.1 putative disease resistance protein RGA4 [Quercus robur]XP_050255798.1 putative disease resistance protein RGA4 [Quercus robur]XP_05025579
MAETVLSVVAEEILGKLISLATEQISLAWGFKDELTRLCDSLTMIQDVLADAERRQVSDQSVMRWLQRLKDVAYDADDVLDELAYEILKRKVEIRNHMKRKVCFFFSFSNSIAFRCKMANKVKAIAESLKRINDEANQYGLTRVELVNANPEIIPSHRETDSSLDHSEVVGRKDLVSEIVELLLNAANQRLSVIPIVGMAGLGKTTLAKLVYNHELVKKHFDKTIWVCVSNEFKDKRILEEILESLTDKPGPLKNKNTILERLQEKLQGQKYILVLDDVWNEDLVKWETLKSSLIGMNLNVGNSIIVTTRSDKVAEIMETFPRRHLEKLSEDDCWSIIKKKVSLNEKIPLTPNLEAIGKGIAKKCGGVPLLARLLGGMMYCKKEESEWVAIQNSSVWNSLIESNGFLSILKLSFDHLYSPSLKRCFTYCAIFPKDYEMGKEELVQHWMAEGFLQPTQERFSPEDNGFKYFDILLANSLFQDIKRDNYGDIVSCKMHDLVHDFALSISKGETLHLDDTVGNDTELSHIRRLSIICNDQTTPTILQSRDVMGRLRTIYSIGANLGDKLLELKCVRSLSLSGIHVDELPRSIGEFRHLRLLRIDCTDIKVLPNSVTKLYNLQTLIIKSCYLLKELPKDLRNLISLRHVAIDHRRIKQLPINMGQLTCLQTLPFFVIGQDAGHRIEEVGCLSQLRGKLSIYNLEHVRDKEEAKTANLVGKAGVQKLGFYWNRERDGNNNDEDVLEGLQPHPSLKSLEIENFKGEKFPSWILARDNSSGGLFVLDHLLEIRLKNCNKCNKIPTLGHLPCLKVLQIERMDNVTCIETEFYIYYGGERSSNSGGGSGRNVVFPALKTLVLKYLPNLVEWKDAMELTTIETVFPCLEELTIRYCGQLTSAPYHFPSLKKLNIYEIKSTAFERIISKLTALTSLQIWYISELVCLPEQLLQNNRSLMSIDIYDCSDLVSISLPQDATSLQSFRISGCKKLSELSNAPLTLPSLETFEVSGCPNLRSFPSLQGAGSLLRSLAISCGDEVLPTALQSCTSLSSLSIEECPNLILIPELRKLHSLTVLEICDCPNLKSIPDLGELHSLSSLSIFRCQTLKLTCLPKELECVTRLKYLAIGGFCEELDAFPSLSSIQHLHTSLELLSLYGWAKLNSLPDEIQHFTSLGCLSIHNFDGLEALPEWLGDFSSLQTLGFWYCKNLMYLPTSQAMQRLTKLHLLRIYSCPKLKERCAEGSGAEWSKIAHIPNVNV